MKFWVAIKQSHDLWRIIEQETDRNVASDLAYDDAQEIVAAHNMSLIARDMAVADRVSL